MNSADINTADILEREIELLRARADSEQGGMGVYYTTISVLEQRLRELRDEE